MRRGLFSHQNPFPLPLPRWRLGLAIVGYEHLTKIWKAGDKEEGRNFILKGRTNSGYPVFLNKATGESAERTSGPFFVSSRREQVVSPCTSPGNEELMMLK